MNDPQDPLLLDHEADGIRELDNNLPRWWLWLFYLTIGFSVGYLGYFHALHAERNQLAEYRTEMAIGNRIKSEALTRFETQLTSLQPSKSEAVLSHGRQVYTTYCSPCHRPDGGGLVGPNLCDDYWIHGSNYIDHVKIILNGVPEKGMVTWKGVLKPAEIQAVASYIETFRGTRPVNPKPPENQAPAPTGPNEFE